MALALIDRTGAINGGGSDREEAARKIGLPLRHIHNRGAPGHLTVSLHRRARERTSQPEGASLPRGDGENADAFWGMMRVLAPFTRQGDRSPIFAITLSSFPEVTGEY